MAERPAGNTTNGSNPGGPTNNAQGHFARNWQLSTADHNLTLYGFRRFKTSHLLNLRLLEDEIGKLDRMVFQAGLGLGLEISPEDRLGLNYCRLDKESVDFEKLLQDGSMEKLRQLLKDYGEKQLQTARSGSIDRCATDNALVSFSQIMSLETFSLLDDEQQSSYHQELSLPEMHKMRLLRVDKQFDRIRQDPIQQWLQKTLRNRHYRNLAARSSSVDDCRPRIVRGAKEWSQQSTSYVASIIARVISALLLAAFLLVPLVLLSEQSSKGIQLAIITVSIILFCCFVSVMLKVSHLEMIIVCAAYTAILSVFISNAPASF